MRELELLIQRVAHHLDVLTTVMILATLALVLLAAIQFIYLAAVLAQAKSVEHHLDTVAKNLTILTGKLITPSRNLNGSQ